MSTKDVPAFEDLTPVSVADRDESENITLEPGEYIVGELRSIEHNVGEYQNTLITLSRGVGDTVSMWSCKSLNRDLEAADLGPGDVVGIRKAEEKEQFDNESGETVEYYRYEVRQQ